MVWILIISQSCMLKTWSSACGTPEMVDPLLDEVPWVRQGEYALKEMWVGLLSLSLGFLAVLFYVVLFCHVQHSSKGTAPVSPG